MPQLARLKIVAITAFPSDEARARILDYGATDYWVKPVDASQIIDVLGEESRNTMTTTT
jgi:CheY-like chemotaxis protein